MIQPRPRNRRIRIVIETTAPADVSEGDVLAAIPQPTSIYLPDGDRRVRVALRYRRWSAAIAPLAAVEAVIRTLERGGYPFAITATLRGAIRQMKGA